MFDTRAYDREAFERVLGGRHEISYLEPRLTCETARLAEGHEVACSFVNDHLDEPALETLAEIGVRLVALRSAGFNHVDLRAAERLGVPVVRVPEYSPHAVAEHAVGLALSLNRKIHRAYARVRELNFSLEGLVGFDLHGKTAGIVGTGRIGRAAARIFRGFGCSVILCDARPDTEFARSIEAEYVTVEELFRRADVVTLHVPLTPSTHHLVDAAMLRAMKPSALLINTGRGALIDSRALIDALKRRAIAGAGLDVYEEEEGIFFHDLSNEVLEDDVLARLLTFPNVLVTAHQAFLTRDALEAIAVTTLESVSAFEEGRTLDYEVRAADVLSS